MKKTLLALSMSLLAITSFAQEHVIRFAHVQGQNTPKGAGAEKFKELAEKYTNGRVRVEVYHDSKLYTDRESAKAVAENKVEMLAPTTSQMGLFYKDGASNPWAAFDIPFLFSKSEDIAKMKEKGLFKEFNEKMAPEHVYVLDLWDNGFRGLSTNFEINEYNDLAKMRPRIPYSLILRSQYLSWGAYPRVTDYGALYNATLYNLVDSSDNPPSSFLNSRLMAVQRYFYTSNHAYLAYGVLVRKNFWDALPKDIQESLNKALAETTKSVAELAKRDNDFALEYIISTGLTRVKPMPEKVLKQMQSKADEIAEVMSPAQKTAYQKIKAVVDGK